MTDAIHALATHVADTPSERLAQAHPAARTFILDTLGVGIVGSAGPMAGDLVRTVATMGTAPDARVWSTGERLPAALAAQCNAYQAHCQEYDCVHEEAVAHVVTVVLPTALAFAERVGGVSGRALLDAVILGVDVAATLGVAAKSGLRFFRPATVGIFGAVAAMGRLAGFDRTRMVHAFSLAYGQVSGTMQAHTEGSLLLAMQIGFNARNALAAHDFAAAGFTGPVNILEGDFGYFRLIEDGGDIAARTASLGQRWRIDEVAHKPFPSGRATHGIIDACLHLRATEGFDPGRISRVDLTVPPLIQHLVGRPPKTEMAINYARLCARYTAACALIGGTIRLDDFTDDAYRRNAHQALANLVTMTVREGDDPNALVPIDLEIELDDGRVLTHRVADVYGAPSNPMTREAQLAKFRQNCAGAARPLPEAQVEDLIAAVDDLADLPDATRLVDLAIAP